MKFSLNELRVLIVEAIRKAYELLGVAPGASPEEIKKAYRTAASALHPDRNPGQNTGPKMAQLNVAYGLLSNPEKRRTYDVMGDKTLGDYGSSAGPRPSPPTQNPQDSWAHRARAAADAEKKAQQAARQARADAEDRDRREYQRQRANTPPPAGNAASGPPTRRRTFHFIEGSSRKKWSIWRKDNVVYVEYGRLGFLGRINKNQFSDWAEASDFVNKKIAEKVHKGYKEVVDQSAPPSPQGTPPKAAAPKPASTGRKETYKIYGKRPGGPAHTRHKGKVYVAAPDTKFKNGDKANVEPNGEKLKVKDPATGHTQDWKAESLSRWVDEILLEMYDR